MNDFWQEPYTVCMCDFGRRDGQRLNANIADLAPIIMVRVNPNFGLCCLHSLKAYYCYCTLCLGVLADILQRKEN